MDDTLYGAGYGVSNSPYSMGSQAHDINNGLYPNQQINRMAAISMTSYPNQNPSDIVSSMSTMAISSPLNSQGGFNLSANEFYPKLNSSLHQSSSAPSFDAYHTAANLSKPMQTVLENVNSPNLTPSGSPQMRMRRNKSPGLPVLDQPHANPQHDFVREKLGGTTYFYNNDEYSQSPSTRQLSYPMYSMYTSTPPHVAHLKLNATSSHFFMKEEIKMELLNKQAAVLCAEDTPSDIPEQVDTYCHLVPLDTSSGSLNHFGYPSSVYKAISQKDSLAYCLHRVQGFKLTNTKCMSIIEQWKKISCASIVSLREVFTTKSFGDNSIVFVYDFHGGAETLANKHFSNPNIRNGYANPFNIDGAARPYSAGKGSRKPGGMINEPTIWSYIIQLSSAIRVIHSNKLAFHCLEPSKILVTDKNRLRVNCGGMVDVLTSDPNTNPQSLLAQFQRDDLHGLGRIILSLACNSPLAIQKEHLKSSVDLIKRHYSPDLYNIITYLLFSNPQPPVSINNIMPMIGARFYNQMECLLNKVDSIEHELLKECESGRLFRLLAKLNSILERTEFNMDPQWSETGDRYLLKLFRDYVFHQTDANGSPWIDMAHIISSLNKLDAGVSEKICLASRDDTSVIIASYAEIKRCFETAYNELFQGNYIPPYSS